MPRSKKKPNTLEITTRQRTAWLTELKDLTIDQIIGRWQDDHNKYLIAGLVQYIRELEKDTLTLTKELSDVRQELASLFPEDDIGT